MAQSEFNSQEKVRKSYTHLIERGVEHPKESHDTTQELKFIKNFQVLEWSFYQNLKANKDRWENLADIIIKYFQNSFNRLWSETPRDYLHHLGLLAGRDVTSLLAPSLSCSTSKQACLLMSCLVWSYSWRAHKHKTSMKIRASIKRWKEGDPTVLPRGQCSPGCWLGT